MIKVEFTIGDLRDALYFTPAEYASLTPAELENRKQQRFATWQARIAAASMIDEPAEEVGDGG